MNHHCFNNSFIKKKCKEKKSIINNLQLLSFLFVFACTFIVSAQENIAEGKTVTMSTIAGAKDGHFIVDGKDEITKEEAAKADFTSKTKRLNYQWIQIDLGASYELKKVTISISGIEFLNTESRSNSLLLVVSDDPDFKNIHNPVDCASSGFATKILSVSQRAEEPISITPISSKMVGRYVRIWDRQYEGVQLTEVKIEGKLSSKAVENALKGGDADEANRVLSERINSGGSIDQEATLKLAIDQKNADMVQTVLANNNTVSSTVFEYALANNYNSNVLKQLLSSGEVDISSSAINTVITKKDSQVIDKMLLENKSAFNSSHVDAAFKSGQTDIAKKILSKAKLTPSATALSAAVKSGDFLLVSDMINSFGGSPTEAMLTEAISGGNQSLINLLLVKVKPNSDAYVLAAEKNDLELYNSLTAVKGLPDNRSIQTAIEKGYLKILKAGLSKGGNQNDALSYAVQKDKSDIVNYLITREGIDVKPVLDYAISKSNKQLLTSLLTDYNADANLALSKAITANKDDLAIIALETDKTNPSKYLKDAVEKDKDILAKKIVEHGGDPDQGMEVAIKKNKTALVDFFIQNNASISNPTFMKTAAISNFAITKMLVDSGADANNGMLAASKANQLDIVNFLLENDADPNKGMAVASASGFTPIVTSLLENGGNSALGIEPAVKGNHTNTALLLLDNEADATSPNLIEMSAAKNNIELVTALISNGASAQNGMSSSIQNNALKVFNLLLGNEATVEDPKHMELAVKNSAYKIIPVLVGQSIDINYTTANGSSYIHTSIANANNLNTVMVLLKAGVNPNSKDNQGNSLLHTAAMKGREYIPIIQALAEAGADVNALNNDGKTPRKVAKNQKTKTAIKKLGGERKIKN